MEMQMWSKCISRERVFQTKETTNKMVLKKEIKLYFNLLSKKKPKCLVKFKKQHRSPFDWSSDWGEEQQYMKARNNREEDYAMGPEGHWDECGGY